ncbi:MAG: ATP-binding protein [Leadbetterella sp.]
MHFRTIFSELKKHLYKPQITVITGLRRVGKSTALRFLLEEVNHTNKTYIDLEKIENRILFSEKSYTTIESGLKSLGLDFSSNCVIAIDEIQLVPESVSVVKYLYDTYGIKFLLSGSSSYYLKNHFSESLAGRKRIFEMYPLSFQEFLIFKGIPLVEVEAIKQNTFNEFIYARYKPHYEEFIQYGGFPEVVLSDSKEDKIAYLKDVINAYIELDIKLLSDFKMSNELYKLIQLLAARVCSRLDVSKLSSISGINRNKVNDYLELLEYTYFIHRIPPFTKNKDKEISGQSKLYFADTGVLQILAQVGSGQVFENVVALQLKSKGNIAYYQRKTGQEIDFILNEGIGIEVKETPSDRDLKVLTQRCIELEIKETMLIARHAPGSDFKEWYWGGNVV